MMASLLYVDPGSGSYLIQALVAGVAGFLFFFKNIKLYIRARWRELFRKKDS